MDLDLTKEIADKVEDGLLRNLIGTEACIAARIRDDLTKYPVNEYRYLTVASGFSFRFTRRELFDGRLFIVVEHLMKYDTTNLSISKHEYKVRVGDTGMALTTYRNGFNNALYKVINSAFKAAHSKCRIDLDTLANQYQFTDNLAAYEVNLQEHLNESIVGE